VSTNPFRRMIRCLPAVILVALIGTSPAFAGTLTVLHAFDFDDGANPNGGVTLGGSTLYGTTISGGANGQGTVFSLATNGTGFQTIRAFSTAANDVMHPWSGLTLGGSTLYGTTQHDGGSFFTGGSVFKLNTNGTGFSRLALFGAAGTNDLHDGLLLIDSTLYGTSRGANSESTPKVFRVDTSGPPTTTLHTFSGQPNVERPVGRLVEMDEVLYGVAGGSGTAQSVIYSMALDGSDYQVLHTLTTADGNSPESGLTLDGTTLYGTSSLGGANGFGTVYAVDIDGSNFQVLHSFAGGASDGASPFTALVVDGGKLYGATSFGGGTDAGTLFSLNTDGSGYQMLHAFDSPTQGHEVGKDLVIDGTTLYGSTRYGGPSEWGTVFAYSLLVPEPSTWVMALMATMSLSSLAWRNRKRRQA